MDLRPAVPYPRGNLDYVASLRAEIARLRAGLASLRRDHYTACVQINMGADPSLFCICGANEVNAGIDALLKGDPDA